MLTNKEKEKFELIIKDKTYLKKMNLIRRIKFFFISMCYRIFKKSL